ncbi:hypothetical protein JL721_11310 [Aureococcus anophagefferens]|nr:hypothetical protein JL721_11310 [Aureococcus anophagefferens]
MMAASMRWFARLALLVHACLALRTPSTIARKGPCTLRTPSTIARNAPCTKTSRRRLLLGVSALVAPSAALALDPSFPRVDEGARKPNILLNKPLEWIRIADQLEADETLGELADPKQKDAPAVRLAKVVRLDDSLRGLAPLLDSRDGWTKARKTLSDPAFEKKNFKRAFNAYSDNVYYERSDPDRANLYLLGGTPASNKQTIQYLHRNDALDNVEKLQSEIDYLLTNKDGDSTVGREASTPTTSGVLRSAPEDKRDARALLRKKNWARSTALAASSSWAGSSISTSQISGIRSMRYAPTRWSTSLRWCQKRPPRRTTTLGPSMPTKSTVPVMPTSRFSAS